MPHDKFQLVEDLQRVNLWCQVKSSLLRPQNNFCHLWQIVELLVNVSWIRNAILPGAFFFPHRFLCFFFSLRSSVPRCVRWRVQRGQGSGSRGRGHPPLSRYSPRAVASEGRLAASRLRPTVIAYVLMIPRGWFAIGILDHFYGGENCTQRNAQILTVSLRCLTEMDPRLWKQHRN